MLLFTDLGDHRGAMRHFRFNFGFRLGLPILAVVEKTRTTHRTDEKLYHTLCIASVS